MDRLEKLALWHQVSSASYLGPVRFRQLWRILGEDLGRVFSMTDEQLAELRGVGTSQSIKGIREQATRHKASLQFMREQLELAAAAGGEILTLDDPTYPQFLANSKMCHALVYCVGDVGAFVSYDKALAIVGTRSAAAQSRGVARGTAEELARKGWVIVSGMAKGIDSEAHEGALAAAGRTIAVLGCGPDVVYPRDARSLYDRIRSRGLIISEYPFGDRVSTLKLKKRNKTTVALALGAFLVESDADGGAMNAVRACKEQSKQAFTIIPGWQCKQSGNELAAKEGAVVLPAGPDLVPTFLRKIKMVESTGDEDE
jgi:DNA processing protein